MEMTTGVESGVCFVRVSGRLDALTAPDFDRQFAPAAAGGKAFVIDLTGLEYISSAGLRSMLVAAKLVKAGSGSLCLFGLAPAVKEVFRISGFHTILTLRETEAEALRALP